jgi:hypothetical protein
VTQSVLKLKHNTPLATKSPVTTVVGTKYNGLQTEGEKPKQNGLKYENFQEPFQGCCNQPAP